MPGSENSLPLPIYCFCPFFEQPHPVPTASASRSSSSQPTLCSPCVHTQTATTELVGEVFSVQSYTDFAQIVLDFCTRVPVRAGRWSPERSRQHGARGARTGPAPPRHPGQPPRPGIADRSTTVGKKKHFSVK